jgi:RHS repeat-associated protein
MRFAGHWRDFLGLLNVDNTDYIDYMHARYYDPNGGRFLSVDPVIDVKRALGSPQRWNRYGYVVNNPINKVDPDGREDPNEMAALMGNIPTRESLQHVLSTTEGKVIAGLYALPPLVAATVKVGPALLTAFLTNPSGFTNALGNLLSPPGSSGVSNPVPSEFFKEVSTTKGGIGILANATTKGTSLTLSNVAVYPMASGSLTNQVGTKEILGVLKQLGGELKALGYTKLTIQGVRASGANPGKVVDIVVDLTKLKL